jgi:hypothetical protein
LKGIGESDGLDLLLKDKLAGFRDTFEDIKKYDHYLYFKKIDITANEYAQL